MSKDTVLIEIEDWTLESRNVYLKDHIGICHTQCKSSWMYYTAKGSVCSVCDKRIPDNVMGLWFLYNFEEDMQLHIP